MTNKSFKMSTEQARQIFANIALSKKQALAKTGKNKGLGGHSAEDLIGIQKSSDLLDCLDGDVKTFRVGNTIGITMLQHCLDEIIQGVPFEETRVYAKHVKTLYIVLKGKEYLGHKVIDLRDYPELFKEEKEDFGRIASVVQEAVRLGVTIGEVNDGHGTVNGPNKTMQLRTAGGKKKRPLIYNGSVLHEQVLRFYSMSKIGKWVAAMDLAL